MAGRTGRDPERGDSPAGREDDMARRIGDAAETVGQAAGAVSGSAEKLARTDALQQGARLGYAVSGVIHVLIGALALRLATGDRSTDADQSGALQILAETGVGWFLLGLCALGFVFLCLWQFVQVVRRTPVGTRSRAAAKGVLYLALAVGATGFLFGRPPSSTRQTRDLTAQVMALPFGTVLVAIAGLAVIGGGAYHVVKGARHRFLDDLVEKPAAPLVNLAVIGYVAKGAALVVTGILIVQAAWTRNPGRSTGLDGALSSLLSVPAGAALVAALGLGFAAYGFYSFARARYART